MARFDPTSYGATRFQEMAEEAAKQPQVLPTTPGATPLRKKAEASGLLSPGESYTSAYAKSFSVPFLGKVDLTEDGAAIDKLPYYRRVGEDAANLALGVSALPTTLLLDAFEDPKKVGGQIAVGALKGVIDLLDMEQWKRHPLLNTLNLFAGAGAVAGVAKSSALAGVRGAAIDAARIAAAEAGGDAALIAVTFKSPKPLRAAIYEAARTRSTEPVVSTLSVQLAKSGVPLDAIAGIAKQIADSTMGKFLTENGAKLTAMDAVIHPLQAFGKSATFISRPVRELIFGTPEKSAVGKLYGSAVVKTDVRGFGLIEEWAGKQVEERGWKDTVDNRVRVQLDWFDENPRYAGMTPKERVAHMKEYVENDFILQRFARAQGREYVLTKALPKHEVEAMAGAASRFDKKLTNSQAITKLEEAYGKPFAAHADEVRGRLTGKLEGTDRAPLIAAIQALGNSKIPVILNKLSKAEKALIADLSKSEWRVGYAPKNKPVSQASDLVHELQVGITSSQALNPRVAQVLAEGEALFKAGKEKEGMAKMQEVTNLTEGDLRLTLNDGSTEVVRLEMNTHGLYFGIPEASYWLTVRTTNLTETLGSLASFAKTHAQDSFVTGRSLGRKSTQGLWGFTAKFQRKLSSEDVVKIEKIANDNGIGLTLNQGTGEAVMFNVKRMDNMTQEQFTAAAMKAHQALKKAGYRVPMKIDKYEIGDYTKGTYDDLIKNSSAASRRQDGGGVDGGLGKGGAATARRPSGDDAGHLSPQQADLITERSLIGRILDNLGLSPEGKLDGTQFFLFRESFAQGVSKALGDVKTIVMNGEKYPIETLAYTLERARTTLLAGFEVFRAKHTISDLRYADFKKFGFSEEDALMLDRVTRDSLRMSPAMVGLGEALSNYLRSANNPLSRGFNHFVRLVPHYRFKLNPFFGMQAAVEAIVWGNMWAKTMPGVITSVKAYNSAVQKLNRLTGLKTPIVQSARESTMAEQQMVLSEIMGDYHRQLRDAGADPMIQRGSMETPSTIAEEGGGLRGVLDAAKHRAQIADSNLVLGISGFSNVKTATNLMKSYSKRFGMTLEDAVAFKMVGSKKVYDHPWMVDNMKSAVQGIFGYKVGVLTSPLIRTLNVVFFPIRFQTKTMIQTAQWLGSLSPASRLLVLNQLTATAQWLTTPEGDQWRKKNRGMFASLFNYVFAFEGIGKSVNAATRGQLFGGNTGLIGGLPFGFVSNIAHDLGYLKEDAQINTSTGKPFQREVIRDTASFAAFVTVVEDIISSLVPAMPFYTASAGLYTFSPNREVKQFVEQTLSAIAGAADPEKETSDYERNIRKERINVRPDYQKKFPNPLNFILPQTAEAAELPALRQNQFRYIKENSRASFFSTDKKALIAPHAPGGSSKVVQGVDISSYATDPGHEQKIARIVGEIPEMTNPVEIDNYIKSVAATSSVRGGMVKRAADAYGVSVRLLLAIMQQDSHFGTKGKGAKTRNPGNYGNNDDGQMIHFKTWEDGVRAVAAWLSDHKVSESFALSTQ